MMVVGHDRRIVRFAAEGSAVPEGRLWFADAASDGGTGKGAGRAEMPYRRPNSGACHRGSIDMPQTGVAHICCRAGGLMVVPCAA
jgi:hypothetical protein